MRALFQHLEARYIFRIAYNPQHEQAQELVSFLDDVASCSGNLSCQLMQTEEPKLEFTLVKDGTETGIKFRGIPNGHEFTSLLLAVLNADGKGKICRTKQSAGVSRHCKVPSACRLMYR